MMMMMTIMMMMMMMMMMIVSDLAYILKMGTPSDGVNDDDDGEEKDDIGQQDVAGVAC